MKYATKFVLQPNWKLFLIDLGVRPEDVLRQASLPLDAFNRGKMELTPAQYFQFWNALEDSAGVEHLPLKIGQMLTVELFDPAIFACVCSPNLQIALERFALFKKLIGPIHLHPIKDTKAFRLEVEFYQVGETVPNSMMLTELIFFTQLARLCTRSQVTPLRVTLPELPNDLDRYHDFFGVRPQQGNTISIHFSLADSEKPFLTANPTMWSFFEPNLRQSLANLDDTIPTQDKVKAILLESLPAGFSRIEDIADRLALSKRTLQRLLEDEQTNFQSILDDTRLSLAEHYLSQSSISPSEVSYLLGFQEVNSFSRAFKKWTGETPNTFRHRYS
ncbi:AraC-type DNA-binding protein [Acinetobacter marinus]|uniref:AraC-type DNA-binding protein n=1 Tax=Acinetobacter marinus TaxID=281375 RepID=A0A1G6HH53_9GAMM|nr:AraC family transcriptional regulator [Acinetobacter marinus]SDB93504.1 AraC-type DNA-binding protein [Acinetobacter marinus]